MAPCRSTFGHSGYHKKFTMTGFGLCNCIFRWSSDKGWTVDRLLCDTHPLSTMMQQYLSHTRTHLRVIMIIYSIYVISQCADSFIRYIIYIGLFLIPFSMTYILYVMSTYIVAWVNSSPWSAGSRYFATGKFLWTELADVGMIFQLVALGYCTYNWTEDCCFVFSSIFGARMLQ